MAIPATYDLNYYSGDTLVFYIRPTTPDGDQIDLDGWTAEFKIADVRGAEPTFSTSATATIEEPLIVCTISPAVGETLIDSSYVYDVTVSNGASNIYTYLTGNLYVTQSVQEV